jgi:type IV secretory pathway VirB10-like protein
MTIARLAAELAGQVAEVPRGPAPSRVHILSDKPPKKKSEARRDEAGRDSCASPPPRPPQPASTSAPIIRPFGRPSQEEAMPSGVYPRKPKAQDEAAANATPKTKRKRKARAAKPAAPAASSSRRRRSSEARFGVFEDGSVIVAAPGCKGKLTGEEAADLVEFITRLKGTGWVNK